MSILEAAIASTWLLEILDAVLLLAYAALGSLDEWLILTAILLSQIDNSRHGH
jgi:hypothetical protein